VCSLYALEALPAAWLAETPSESAAGAQDLTDEQKVLLIRRQWSECTREEAMNALEASAGDVDAAIASISQVS
jgi:NACalpha-BTF3-like transcription factor